MDEGSGPGCEGLRRADGDGRWGGGGMALNAGEACVEQPVEGRWEESNARGSDPIKESAGTASSQIQQRSFFFPFVTHPRMNPS